MAWMKRTGGCVVTHCSPADMPHFRIRILFSKFYRAQGFDKNGPTWMFLAKGHKDYPKRIFVFYTNGRIWLSYKNDLYDAITGAKEDAWKYMNPASDRSTDEHIYSYYMIKNLINGWDKCYF